VASDFEQAELDDRRVQFGGTSDTVDDSIKLTYVEDSNRATKQSFPVTLESARVWLWVRK